MKLEPNKQYKVLFIDLNMPIMNGFEATEKIRELYEGIAGQPFLIGISGDTGPEVEEQCKAVGMNMLRTFFIAYKKYTKK